MPNRFLATPDRRLRRRALTLVEVLVAVAILSILAGIGITKYTSAIHQARIAKAKTTLESISLRIDAFRDRRERLPLTLGEIGEDDVLDPWGNPFMYLNFEAGTGSAVQFVQKNGLIDPTFFDETKKSKKLPDPDVTAKPKDVEKIKRKDQFLFPLNSDYDLFCLGPNGKSWASLAEEFSLDDIIRANDGAYFGLASEY
jgi:general secretion pathway protein G